MKKRWKIISNQIASFEPKGTTKESDQLTNYLKDHQSYFLYLWSRIDNLQSESKKIVPLHLRQDPVSQSSLSGQSLYAYSSRIHWFPWNRRLLARVFSGPEISLQDHEEVVILNNCDPLKWTIQNSRGQVGEVPSVCIWIPGPDVISAEKTSRYE